MPPLGRLRDAMADAAETLRRLFQGTPVHRPVIELPEITLRGLPPWEVRAQQPRKDWSASAVQPRWRLEARVRPEPMGWEPRVAQEDAWARWAAGARVWTQEVFGSARGRQVQVPPLPRRVGTRRWPLEGFRLSLRRYRPGLSGPVSMRAETAFRTPNVRQDLAWILGWPVALTGEDPQRLPKARWMRYTLALVKSTGENIRALDVLGVFQVPVRGVVGLRYDARTGRVLLELSREASGAPRVPMILARRREDRTILTCFPEEGP